MPEAAGIKVERLSRVFPPNVIALRSVNLEIKPGEFFVILGPSGSGKTTLLRIIAGLEVPTEGRVVIGGKVVVDAEEGIYVEPKDRDIGMVFQNWALYPHMTAYDNIAFPLRIKKLPKEEIDRRVRSVAEALGISELLDRKPTHMSGGQQQRVAVARALVKQPKVLLLDEPFSNLDARIRVSAREFVKELQRKLGITTILVTHDQADAFAVGDRVAVLRNGVIQQVGTPDELYDEPVNVFVANFIGDPPMNIVKVVSNHEVIKSLGLTDLVKGNEYVYVGIRPDEAVASSNSVDTHLSGEVVLIEHAGSRRYARVRTDVGLTLKVLADEGLVEGGRAYVRIKKMHLFSEGGSRITTLKL